jgi:hypothetical protein
MLPKSRSAHALPMHRSTCSGERSTRLPLGTRSSPGSRCCSPIRRWPRTSRWPADATARPPDRWCAYERAHGGRQGIVAGRVAQLVWALVVPSAPGERDLWTSSITLTSSRGVMAAACAVQPAPPGHRLSAGAARRAVAVRTRRRPCHIAGGGSRNALLVAANCGRHRAGLVRQLLWRASARV